MSMLVAELLQENRKLRALLVQVQDELTTIMIMADEGITAPMAHGSPCELRASLLQEISRRIPSLIGTFTVPETKI